MQASVSDTAAGLAGPVVTATITVTVVSPTSLVGALDYRTADTSIPVTWTGTAGSGGPIASYQVWVSIDGGAFTRWLVATPDTSATFTAETGHTYGFISQATDAAGNVEPQHAAADTTVTVMANPWQNPGNPLDVLGTGGAIVPEDVLAIIDYLTLHLGDSSLPAAAQDGSDYLDVLGEGNVLPADALAVIDYLNEHPASSAIGTAAVPAPAAVGAPIADTVAVASDTTGPPAVSPGPAVSASPAVGVGAPAVAVQPGGANIASGPAVTPAIAAANVGGSAAVVPAASGAAISGDSSAANSAGSATFASGPVRQDSSTERTRTIDILLSNLDEDWWS